MITIYINIVIYLKSKTAPSDMEDQDWNITPQNTHLNKGIKLVLVGNSSECCITIEQTFIIIVQG